MLGVIDDVTRRTPSGFVAEGHRILLLGTTRDELSGSEWAHVVHGHLGGLPPQVDLAAERRLGDLLVDASRGRLLASAHDLSEGGLAQALVESCLRHDVGARVTLPADDDAFVALFSESAGRAIVAVTPAQEDELSELCRARGVPHQVVGVTAGAGGDALLDVTGHFSVPLAELRSAWAATLPAVLG